MADECVVQDDYCFLGWIDQVVDVVCSLYSPTELRRKYMHHDVAVAWRKKVPQFGRFRQWL